MAHDTLARYAPQAHLGKMLDVIIFEQRPADRSYPTKHADTHEWDSGTVTRIYEAWEQFLFDHKYGSFFSLRRNDALARFEMDLNDEGRKLLKAYGFTPQRLEATVTIPQQNTARRTLNQIFQEHGL